MINTFGEDKTRRIDVKFKIKRPHFQNPVSKRVHRGDHTSHGMLRHKTMLLGTTAKAGSLVPGSFK